MVILDVSIVNVALPSIGRSVRFSTTGLQWVVNAYTITFAGFLLLGGRMADLLGRRRVFLSGTALFLLASLVCSLAGSQPLLVATRALQGFAGAILSPATLAIITSSLPEGPERNRGLGAWSAVGGLGASSGALLGGVLTQTLGWPAIFAVNVPVGLLALVLGARVIAVDDRPAGKRHFDAGGAALVTAGLLALTYGIVRSGRLGWSGPGVVIPLALAVSLLAAFALIETRVATQPLIPLSILGRRQLRAANLVVMLLFASAFSTFFFFTLYLQQVLGQGALRAGLSFLPMTLSVFVTSSLAPRLVAWRGVRAIAAAGMLSATTGLVLLTGVRPGDRYLFPGLPGTMLIGLGVGLALVPATIAATQGVPRPLSGLASGLLNTSRLMGGALGLAALSTIATSHYHPARRSAATLALTHGLARAFTIAVGLCLVAAVVAALRLPGRQAQTN